MSKPKGIHKPKAVKTPKPKVIKPLKPPSKPKKAKKAKAYIQLFLREQGTFTDGPAPADAGAPPNPYWPQEALKPGWSPIKHEAAVESRKAKAIRRGVSPADAQQEAVQFVDRARTRGMQAPDIYIHNHYHGHGDGSNLAGVVHKHPHAHIRGEPHPDPRQHNHVHTGVPGVLQEKLHEKFTWMQPFQVVKEAGRRLVKGVAITIGKSRNDSKYTHDELLRGGRTLAQKPMFINHLETPSQAKAYLAGKRLDTDGVLESTFDPALIPDAVRGAIQSMVQRGDAKVGEVLDSEYEDSGVEYQGAITDPKAIDVVDHEPPLVKGVSIGAFPRNRNLKDPRGIMFSDLSLITDPETPGDPDASLSLMEKLREMARAPAGPDMLDIIDAQIGLVEREYTRRIAAVDAEIAKREATS